MTTVSSSCLNEVGDVERRRHLVEAEAYFQREGAIKREGQADEEAGDADAGEQRETVGVARVAARYVEDAAPVLVEGRKQAAEGEGQQQCRVDGQFGQGETCLGGAVVGGLAVLVQRDAVGEFGRNRLAAGEDMAQLPQRQPGAQGGRQGERRQENEGKDVGHGSGDWGKCARMQAPDMLRLETRRLWHRTRTPSSGWTWR